MSEAPTRPRILKAGIVIINRNTGDIERVVALQYNPDSLQRSLRMQGAGEGTDRLEALRLVGPPVETFTIEAVLDASDQLEFPESNAAVVNRGVSIHLAAIESLLYPKLSQLASQNRQAMLGSIEIMPVVTSLPLFVLGRERVMPIRISDFNVTEEAFDTHLNPIRAKVNLGMRVLSVNDLPYDSVGGNLYRVYQRAKELLGATQASDNPGVLGIGGLL